jgi:hypothetical protein
VLQSKGKATCMTRSSSGTLVISGDVCGRICA